MLPEYPVTQRYISPKKLSWNASGIILGIGTLQVSLTFHNRLNNDRKKIERKYSLCKIIIVRPSNNYYPRFPSLQKLSKEDYTVQDCRLFLPTNIKGR